MNRIVYRIQTLQCNLYVGVFFRRCVKDVAVQRLSHLGVLNEVLCKRIYISFSSSSGIVKNPALLTGFKKPKNLLLNFIF